MRVFNRLSRCFFLFSMFSLWFGGQARATITLVQHNGVDIANATSGSLPFLTNNSGGDWIAVCVRAGRSNEVFTVSDSRGNTYLRAAQFNDTSMRQTETQSQSSTLRTSRRAPIPSWCRTLSQPL